MCAQEDICTDQSPNPYTLTLHVKAGKAMASTSVRPASQTHTAGHAHFADGRDLGPSRDRCGCVHNRAAGMQLVLLVLIGVQHIGLHEWIPLQ